MKGGEKMDLEKALKECLGWNSPIGVGIFFCGSGNPHLSRSTSSPNSNELMRET
jgi:hypothetical protein